MFRGKKSMRRKVKIKTKNEKIIDRYGTKHTEKQLLQSGRNNEM